MLLRLNGMHSGQSASDYELIDILRTLSRYNRDTVIGRHWRVSDLELWPYVTPPPRIGEELYAMFPESPKDSGTDHLIVEGERLMERAALIHQFECCYLLRIVDVTQEV